MPKVDFIVTVGTNLLGGQQNATLNRQTSLVETSTKGTGWESYVAGVKNWNVDADGFVVEDDVAFLALEQAWLDGTELDIEIKSNSEAVTPTTYTGKVYIESFPIESSYSETAKYNISFKGSGALTIVPYSEV